MLTRPPENLIRPHRYGHHSTFIPNIKILEPHVFGDERGFYVLGDGAEFVYKCTDYYNPQAKHCLLWNDPSVKIHWPLTGEPQLSAKDAAGKTLAQAVVFE